MSICATIWRLRFPKEGDDHLGTDWVTVLAQGVLPHVGSPTPGHGSEMGDPFDALWRLLCDALRGDSPRPVATWLAPNGSARVCFDDGTSRQVDA